MELNDLDQPDLQAATVQLDADSQTSNADSDRPLDGRYQVHERLGTGGMATVHRARDLQQNRDVAIKFMNSDLGGSARRRFFREFNTISGIQHPCCLAVFDIGETESAPYFTMELHTGCDVSDVGKRPAREVADILIDLSLAIDYIHSKGIVHRDIKPSNVMVQQQTIAGKQRFSAKLADFGLAKFYHLESSLTSERGFVGTAAYAAPEQIEGRQIDHRCDLYALGIIAYELLSGGYHPFASERGKSLNALLHAQLAIEPEPIANHNDQLTPLLCETVHQYLAKEAEQRPPSAQLLRRTLCDAFEITIDESLERKSTPDDIQINTFGFVCRKREVELVDHYLSSLLQQQHQDPNSDRTSTIIFSGDPGIGKTSLAEEATRKAMSLGFRVYEGRCFDGENSSFHPFIAILRQLFSGLKRSRLDGDLTTEQTAFTTNSPINEQDQGSIEKILWSYRQDLLRVAPELRRWLPGEQSDAPVVGDGQYIFRALSSLFVEISQVRPLCISLDDLQWADHSSLTLLKYLAAALSSLRSQQTSRSNHSRPAQLAIFATARSGYANLEDFLVREQSQAHIQRLELAPFDLHETKLILSLRLGCHAGQVSDRLSQTIDSVCRGNPFFLSETIREWRTRDRIIRSHDTWTLNDDTLNEASLPSTVRSALGARLAELSETARQMLAAGAIIGRVVDLDLLAQVLADIPEHKFLDCIDELLAKRVFVETKTASRVEFGHDLFRELVLSELTANRKRAFHRSIAVAFEEKAKLEPSRVPAATLAMHFLEGEQPQPALKYLLQAAQDAMAAGAFENAAQYLTTAEQKIPTDLLDPHAFELSSKACLVNIALKRLEAAEKYARQAIATAPNTLEKTRFLGELGWIKHQSGDYASAMRHYNESLSPYGLAYNHSIFTRILRTTFAPVVATCIPEAVLRRIYHKLPSESANAICIVTARASYICVPRSSLDATLFAFNEMILGKLSDSPSSKLLAFNATALYLNLSGIFFLAERAQARGDRYLDYVSDSREFAYARTKHSISEYCAGRLEVAEKLGLEGITLLRHSRDHFSSQAYHWVRHVYSIQGNVQKIIEFGNT